MIDFLGAIDRAHDLIESEWGGDGDMGEVAEIAKELIAVLREARASFIPIPTGGGRLRNWRTVDFLKRVDAILARCGP